MILSIDIEAKSIGNKELFKGLKFHVEDQEKVAVIGRNGVGKTTLFNMLTGKDTDFDGSVLLRRGAQVVSTAQEHHELGDMTVLEYVLANLPEYADLKHIIETYPEKMGEKMHMITKYSDALEKFNDLGYYTVEGAITRSLEGYQISEESVHLPMARLSGGQKRFVELVRVEHADADVALIDEPTNHMDYVAKGLFIEWFKATSQTVMVITHDRDVLKYADKIVEIKDGRAKVYHGNYEAYLKQNATSTTAKIHDYQIALRTLDKLHKKILWARARKPAWHGTADQKNPFVVMERRLQKEYDEIQETMEKPSFWIDRESAEGLSEKVGENYAKFKAKNIRINKTAGDTHSSELVRIEGVQLGYAGEPLFKPLNFSLKHGQRLHMIGRNGAGKTTLVRAITAAYQDKPIPTLLAGEIKCGSKLRLSVYEQEIGPQLLHKTLEEAIEIIYRELDMEVSNELVKRTMSDNLFDPHADAGLEVSQLSGGQKARLQIVKLLANNPNMLILDEPTNHLDLPSIEELESALMNYNGALLYVSHDSFFAGNIGGDDLKIRPAAEA